MNTQRQIMFSTPSLTLAERHPRLVIALIVATLTLAALHLALGPNFPIMY